MRMCKFNSYYYHHKKILDKDVEKLLIKVNIFSKNKVEYKK